MERAHDGLRSALVRIVEVVSQPSGARSKAAHAAVVMSYAPSAGASSGC